MKTYQKLWDVAKNGEIIKTNPYNNIKKKYQSDTPLDKSFVPYLVMAICAVVDTSFFVSLFKMISYDSPFMIFIEVLGFLFAFDVVPIYLGIQYKRVKQRLSNDKMIMILALAVIIIGFALNIALRATTISIMTPDLSNASTSYFGAVTASEASGTISPSNISLTICGMGIPIITSVGSFYISYFAYNPLAIKKRKLEELMAADVDAIRRIEALLKEYEADTDFEQRLFADDEGKYEEMKKTHKALVISYCDYVRQRLKEYIANPTSNNILSEECCTEIINRLDKELAALDEERGENVLSSLPDFKATA